MIYDNGCPRSETVGNSGKIRNRKKKKLLNVQNKLEIPFGEILDEAMGFQSGCIITAN